MEPIRYKRLFEIRLLHEYYLIAEDRTSFFDLAINPAEYDRLLRERINDGYTVMNDLQIEPTEKTSVLLKQYGLKYSRTYTGFIVGSSVKALSRPDGSIDYQPRPTLPNDLTLDFWLMAPRPAFRAFSNIGLQQNLSAVYLLDNQVSNKTFDPLIERFPKLSRSIAPYSASTGYQMGDLALFDEGSSPEIRMALETMTSPGSSTNPNNWTAVASHTYLNEQDRRLLPHRFTYKFPIPQTRYEAILQTPDGNEVKRITQIATEPQFRQIDLDFAEKDRLPNQAEAERIPVGEYRLIINGDANSLSENRSVCLVDEFRSSALALISIKLDVADTTYNVLRSDGLLRLRRLPDGSRTATAVYDVWIKSRLAYWRYRTRLAQPLTLPVGSAIATYVSAVSPNLETLRPYLLSSRQTVFREGPTDVFLPQPQPSPVRREIQRDSVQNRDIVRDIVEVYATSVKPNAILV